MINDRLPENFEKCQGIWKSHGVDAHSIGFTTNGDRVIVNGKQGALIEVNVTKALRSLNAKNLVTPGTPIYNESLKEQ